MNTSETNRKERETKFRLNYLADNIELDHPDVINILERVMIDNESLVKQMFINEGKIIGILEGIKIITDTYLNKLNKDYLVRRYIDKPIKEWDFLSTEEMMLIDNLNNAYKEHTRIYIKDKADLMILRKTVFYFINNKLDSINPYVDVSEVLQMITDEYSYDDTLINNGFSPIREGGLPRLDRLYVSKQSNTIIPIDDSAPWLDVRVGRDGKLIHAIQDLDKYK